MLTVFSRLVLASSRKAIRPRRLLAAAATGRPGRVLLRTPSLRVLHLKHPFLASLTLTKLAALLLYRPSPLVPYVSVYSHTHIHTRAHTHAHTRTQACYFCSPVALLVSSPRFASARVEAASSRSYQGLHTCRYLTGPSSFLRLISYTVRVYITQDVTHRLGPPHVDRP